MSRAARVTQVTAGRSQQKGHHECRDSLSSSFYVDSRMQWLSKGEVGKGKGKKPSRCALQGEACSGQAGCELLRLLRLSELEEAQGMGGLRTQTAGGGTCRDWVLCGGTEWITGYQRMAMGGESWPSREKPGPDRTHAYQGARDFSGLNDIA